MKAKKTAELESFSLERREKTLFLMICKIWQVQSNWIGSLQEIQLKVNFGIETWINRVDMFVGFAERDHFEKINN